MRRDATRGQSTVIGAILLFGILITALAGYQAVAVPAQNQGAEYDHNQVVQTDMHDLRNAILNVRAAEGPVATTVRLGTNYPLRVVTINPPPPAGHLSTVDPESSIHIENARVQGDVEGDASVLFEEHETRFITYSPQYNEYHTAPSTTFEHSLLYNRFSNTDLALTEQQLVNGNDVTITLLSGDLSHASAESISVDTRVADGPTDRIPIESDGSGPITIQIPTQSPEMWTQSLGDSFSEGEPNAQVVTSDSTSVTIELAEDGEPYYLQVSRMSVGDDSTPSSDEFDIERADSPTDDSRDSVYDVQWVPEALAEESGISYDATTDTLEIDRDQTGNRVRIGASVTESGAPVKGAAVEFATTDASVLAFGSQTVQTDASGEVTVNLDFITNGETRVFAAAGDDVDSLTVSVTGDTSSGALTGGSVGDLTADTNNQEQRFTFTLANELPEGETVTIDLSDTAGAVSYPNGNGQYSVGRGSGSVTRVSDGVMTYTAGPTDDAGDTIELLVKKVDTRNTFASTYTVTLTRSDGGREDATFSVIERESGSQTVNSEETGDIYVTGSVTINDQLDGSVDAGGSVTVNSGGVTGDVAAGGSVTLNDDVDGFVDASGQVTVNSNGYAGGDVRAGDTVTVNGEVVGSVTSDNKVTVNSNGYVGGDVTAEKDVTVNGEIVGSVSSTKKITLNSGAVIGGDVSVSKKQDLVCNGGQINGQSCSDYKQANY